MNEFKIGDRVKITPSSKYYRGRDSNPKEVPGTIREFYSKPREIGLWIGVTWENGERNSYNHKDLELLPQTQLTLEEVYTYAPQKELREVIGKKAAPFVDPDLASLVPEGTGDIIWWDVEEKCLNSVEKTHKDKHISTRKEVSIPQFLDLLEAFANRKPDPVKVVLNDRITAYVEEGNEVVNVRYQSQELTVTRTQLRELEEGLKGVGHGFVMGDYIDLTDPEITLFLSNYAKSRGIRTEVGDDVARFPSLSYNKDYGLDTVIPGPTQYKTHKLTIDQFLEKCKPTSKPLPNLAGYEVTRVKEGDWYYSGCQAPSEGIALGCQFIPQDHLTQLFQAINH